MPSGSPTSAVVTNAHVNLTLETAFLKHTLLAAAVAIAAVSSAHAADLAPQHRYYAKAPAYASPVYNWTGLYIGLNAGYGTAQNDHTDNAGHWWTLGRAPGATQGINPDGGVYGGQIGYNWQSDRWVFGLEGQFNGASLNRTEASIFWPQDSLRSKIDSYGTITGRVGYAFGPTGNWLTYIKGGYAGANLETNNFDIHGNALNHSAWRSGYVVGAGLEVGLDKNWTVGVEYTYMDLGSQSFSGTDVGGAQAGRPENFSDSLTISTVTARVNYKF